ncbi:MAG: hypothetical protein ABR604_00195 [Jatrophihabitantaceae bacterium]
MSPADDDRAASIRLARAVFFAVLALILILLSVQLIPHAKRPTIRRPSVTTTTIVTTLAPATS